MTTTKNPIRTALVAGSLIITSTAFAQFEGNVYENITTPLNKFHLFGSGLETGDQIFLAGTERTITDFNLQLFANNFPATGGDETVQIRFYSHGDFPGGPPSELIYDSTPLDISGLPDGMTVISIDNLSVLLPAAGKPRTITWSVQFGGVSGTETAGLVLYNPPRIGSSFDDFWQNNGGTWVTQQIDNGATPANFGASFVAVPEPGTIALGAVGVLGLVAFLRRRQS